MGSQWVLQMDLALLASDWWVVLWATQHNYGERSWCKREEKKSFRNLCVRACVCVCVCVRVCVCVCV